MKRKKDEGADATNRKEELKRKEKRNEQDIRVTVIRKKGSNKWKRRLEMKERTQRRERKS